MELVSLFQYGEMFSYYFFYNASQNDWTFFGISLGFGVAAFLIVYSMRAIGLYTVCRREGYKRKWMAFIPFVSTYYIGEVGKKNKLFNQKAIVFSIPTAILEFLMFAAYILFFVVEGYLVAKGYVTYSGETGYVVSVFAKSWMKWIYDYLDIVLSWVSLVYFVMFMFTLMPYFMTYSARRYVIMSVFGAFFPVSGILIFVVRKNTGMEYKEFMQGEQERMYRQYQQNQQNGNPYNYNPYSGRPTPPPSGYGAPDESHAAGQAVDPFDEFDAGDPGSASTSGFYGTMDPFSDGDNDMPDNLSSDEESGADKVMDNDPFSEDDSKSVEGEEDEKQRLSKEKNSSAKKTAKKKEQKEPKSKPDPFGDL